MRCLQYDQIIPGLNRMVPTRSHLWERISCIAAITFLLTFFIPSKQLFAQNKLTGDGFFTNWSSDTVFTTAAGNSQILTRRASGTGNRYFRLKTGSNEYTPGSDLDITSAVNVVQSTALTGTTGAYYINCPNTSDNYVFKTPPSSNASQFVYFRVQGAVQTLVAQSRNPATSVYLSQDVVVTLTTSGTSTGQDFYLRYTKDGYATSTVVKMTGSGTSYTATIPGTFNTAGSNVSYYYFSSGTANVASNGSNADYYTINLLNNGGGNYSYSVTNAYVTTQTGNYTSASTWVGGVVPPAGVSIAVNNGHILTLNTDISLAGVTVNAGGTFNFTDGVSRTLTLSTGATFLNNGTAIATGTSQVVCSGTATISGGGTITFNNLTLNGTTTLNQSSKILGTLQLNSGASIANLSPNYQSGSTLYYATGGIFGRNLEWNATSGNGYPYHVLIGNSTTLNLGAWGGTGTLRQCAGNLTINAGSKLSMNENSEPMSAALRVLGYVLVNGRLELGGSDGGDLRVGGNYTVGVTSGLDGFVVNNGRQTIFEGSSGDQIATKTGTGILYFDYLVVNKSSGNLKFTLGTDATIISYVNNDLSKRVLQLLSGNIDMNDGNITLQGDNENSLNVLVSGAQRKIYTSTGSGEFKIRGSVSTMGVTKFNVISQSGGSLLFDNQVLVSTTVGVDFGASGISTINSIFRIDRYGYCIVHSPNYGTASTLIYNNGTDGYKRNFEWITDTYGSSGTGYPNQVIVQNNTLVELNSTDFPATFALGCSGSFTIESGSSVTTAAMAYPISVGGDLNIYGTFTLSTHSGGLLNVGGSWNRTGTFVQNDRNVNFYGTANGTLTASGGQTFSFVTLNKSTSTAALTLNDAMAVTDSIGLIRGTLTLNNKSVTIVSTATKTARVGVSSKANTVINYSGTSGKFFVQRYMPARRAWRLVTAPFETTGSSTISTAWQEGMAYDYSSPAATTTSTGTDTTTAGYGTQITGGTLGNGFDQGQLNNASIKFFSSGSWVGPANTNATSVNSQEGWMLFVRGDRKNFGEITNQYKAPTVSTLRPRGQIFLGTKTISSSGFTVVGNPYASPVDFTTLGKTGALSGVNTYTVWDPYLGGTYGVGAFVTLTWNGSEFVRSAPLSGTGTSTYDNRYIPSGAAVMVDFASGGSLTFTESDKRNGTTTSAFRPVRAPMASIVLQAAETDGTPFNLDGVLLLFNETFSNAYESGDARKIGNFSENIGISKGNTILSIERRQQPVMGDTIALFMNRLKQRSYQLQIALPRMDAAQQIRAFLEDAYTGKRTLLKPDTTWYRFIVNTDPASYDPARLRLVFTGKPEFHSFSATTRNKNVQLNWVFDDENLVQKYHILRGTSATALLITGDEPARAQSGAVPHQITEAAPENGTWWYQIVADLKDGKSIATEPIQLLIQNGTRSIAVYPNPVKGNSIRVQIPRMASGRYQVRLTDLYGRVQATTFLQHAEDRLVENVSFGSLLRSGWYQLELTGVSGEKLTTKVQVW